MGWLSLSNRHASTYPVPLGFPAGQKEWLLSPGHCSTVLGLASVLSTGLWDYSCLLSPWRHSPLIGLMLSLQHLLEPLCTPEQLDRFQRHLSGGCGVRMCVPASKLKETGLVFLTLDNTTTTEAKGSSVLFQGHLD